MGGIVEAGSRIIEARKRIIVALDVDTLKEAGQLVEELSGHVGMFKVGLQLLSSAGTPQVVECVHSRGGKLFLDGKFFDIPNTVANAAAVVARMGVAMFNVHITGGFDMMKATRKAVDEVMAGGEAPAVRPLILGVSILTSLTYSDLVGMGLAERLDIKNPAELEVAKQERMGEIVALLALLAQEAGLDGVIASPKEIEAILACCGPGFEIVTPGIRPAGVSTDDQKRTDTPEWATRKGASYLVIGRAIREAPNGIPPVEAADAIAASIAAVL